MKTAFQVAVIAMLAILFGPVTSARAFDADDRFAKGSILISTEGG